MQHAKHQIARFAVWYYTSGWFRLPRMQQPALTLRNSAQRGELGSDVKGSIMNDTPAGGNLGGYRGWVQCTMNRNGVPFPYVF